MSDGDETEIVCWDVNKISKDDSLMVEYRSNRGNKQKKSRYGNVISTVKKGENSYDIIIYSEEEERKITIEIRGVISDSRVLSQKTQKRINMGTPITIIHTTDNCTPKGLKNRYISERNNGNLQAVAAAAKIKKNKDIFVWRQENNLL